MQTFLLDVIAGLLTALIALAAKWQWPFMMSLFDRESRRQAKQISGSWTAKEVFANGTNDEFLLEISCVGGETLGDAACYFSIDTICQDGTFCPCHA